jgi:hypothetical protein
MRSTVYELLHEADEARPRSSSGFGPSGFFAPCERQTVLTLLGHPKTNVTDKWPAIRGTAIHAAYEKVRATRGGKCEVPLELDGIRGNCDWLGEENGVLTVEDLKTAKMDKLAWIREHGPSRQHLAQINWYCKAAGARRWRLVYAPVDGGADDWLEVEGDLNLELVAEAIDWYHRMDALAFAGEIPEPGMDPASFCNKYCPFYGDTCQGRTAKAVEYSADPFDDGILPEIEAAATQYREGDALAKRGEQMKKAAREELLGVRGVAGGWVISWTNPAPKDVIDKDAAVARLEQLGEPIPTVQKCSSPAISVKPVTT